MHVGGATPAAGPDSLADQFGDLVEVRGRYRRERRRAADQGEQLVLVPVGGRALGDHLLGQDVERAGRNDERVQPSGAGAAEQRGALDQLVPGRGVEPSGGNPAGGVVRPSDSLQEGREAARGADLADQLDRPDVDAELEGRGGDQGAQVTAAQPGLDPLPAVPGQAAVMSRDLAVAEPLAELMRDPLGHPPGVDEHERRPVPGYVPGDQVKDLRHLLGRGDRAELVSGQVKAEVELAAVTGVHDRAARRAIRLGAAVARSDQEPGHRLDRTLGGRQADPLHRLTGDVGQPLQRQGQVRASLVPGHGVDLVYDHRPGRLQHGPASLGREQQEQRLRRGDQEVRRPLQHGRPLGRRRIAGPHRHPDRGRGQSQLGGYLGNLGQRALQVLPDVDGQRLQRRDVHHLRPGGGCSCLVGRPASLEAGLGGRLVRLVDPVDADQEGGESLARPRGRGDQRVPARRDLGPARSLRLGRPGGEPPGEPGPHGRVERFEHQVRLCQATDIQVRAVVGVTKPDSDSADCVDRPRI